MPLVQSVPMPSDFSTADWSKATLAGIGFVVLIGTVWASVTSARVAQAVHWLYPAVAETSPQALAEELKRPQPPLLLDARTPEEFDTSHLPGAQRVPPDATAEALLAQLGALHGRSVVVYCAVGGRSAMLVQRTQAALTSTGAGPVSHLRGGVFAWQAQGLPLVSGQGLATTNVHPYNWFWGRLRSSP